MVKGSLGGGKYTNHGGKKVWMLAEDDYGEILMKTFHKDTWCKVNADRVITSAV